MTLPTTLLIRGGRIIDPSQQLDRVGNLLVRDGRIAEIEPDSVSPDAGVTDPGSAETIDAAGMIVCPGFVDTHVAFREPGYEEDETIETGTAAALAGGFTSVACTPDTLPVVDNRAAAEFILLQAERAAHCHVFLLGAVTKNHEGKELAEIGQLVEGGAVAFTGGKKPVANAEIMRRALQYTRMFERPILNHPQVPELAEKGVMHEGYFSTLLGLRGIPAAAESIMVGRDIALAELTGGRLHLTCLSTADSAEQVRRAKARGVSVTADVTPHHLTLTDESLRTFDSNFKVDPPLRTAEHIAALIEGLKDGTIDALCSDHQPYSEEKKVAEVDLAPCGIVGLETLLPVCVESLVEAGHLTWPQLIALLTAGPSRVLGIEKGTLQPGRQADVTIIDPSAEWTVDPTRFQSKSRNTPFAGRPVRGRVHTVIVAGQIRYREGQCVLGGV